MATKSDNAHDAVVSVRLSRAQQARLRELATAQGRSLSEYVRDVVTHSIGSEARLTPPTPTTTNSATSSKANLGSGIFLTGPADEQGAPGNLNVRSGL